MMWNRVTRRQALLPMAVSLLLLLPACAARGESGSSASNQITRQQLEQYNNVAEAVQALRSNWTRQRTSLTLTNEWQGGPRDPQTGSRVANPVWVYRDNVRVGDLAVLSNTPTVAVESVQYFDPRSATQRWGRTMKTVRSI